MLFTSRLRHLKFRLHPPDGFDSIAQAHRSKGPVLAFDLEGFAPANRSTLRLYLRTQALKQQIASMKDAMKRFTIAVTGDFGEHRGFEKMRQWIQVNGATFSYDVSPIVTHLICSKEHFRKNVTMGRHSFDCFHLMFQCSHMLQSK